jgi:hypothetical protein
MVHNFHGAAKLNEDAAKMVAAVNHARFQGGVAILTTLKAIVEDHGEYFYVDGGQCICGSHCKHIQKVAEVRQARVKALVSLAATRAN